MSAGTRVVPGGLGSRASSAQYVNDKARRLTFAGGLDGTGAAILPVKHDGQLTSGDTRSSFAQVRRSTGGTPLVRVPLLVSGGEWWYRRPLGSRLPPPPPRTIAIMKTFDLARAHSSFRRDVDRRVVDGRDVAIKIKKLEVAIQRRESR